MKLIKSIVKKMLSSIGVILIRKEHLIKDGVIHSSQKWDITTNDGYWVGGKFGVYNFSGGYHGILKQWFDSYCGIHSKCLLISENNKVKESFEKEYPKMDFRTLDYYDNMGEEVDFGFDICSQKVSEIQEEFGLILCQATLEHLYDPWNAMKNMKNLLTDSGVILIHTHVPGYYYHPYPRDYLRYHPDWFLDLEKFMENIKLKELIVKDFHIFALYQKEN